MRTRLIAVVVAGGAAAMIAAASASPRVDAGLRKPCAASAAKVATFKKTMAAKRRAYFKTHKKARHRRAFVSVQHKRLKALQRAHRQCLKRAKKAPGPPAPPPPALPAPDRTPPALTIDSPLDGSWFGTPSATLQGTASDAESGIESVTCNGAGASRSGVGFSCQVALSPGPNRVLVRALDRAGNAVSRERVLEHLPGGVTGGPQAPAVQVLPDVFSADVAVPESEVGTDTSGGRFARTQLELGFRQSTTVSELNSLLRAAGATIVSAQPGVAILLARIPDGQLDNALSRLESDPHVRFARRSRFLSADELPGNVDVTATDAADQLSKIEHQLAVGAHAAWHARSLIESPPTLLVSDAFGAGVPSSKANGITIGLASDFASSGFSYHGYHVLGIAAARWDPQPETELAPGLDIAVGIYPGELPLRAVDMSAGLTLPAIEDAIARLVRFSGARVVVNTSQGFTCNTPATDAAICNAAEARKEALIWIEKVRGTIPGAVDLESRFIHVASAGNVYVADKTEAKHNSPWNAAGLIGQLTTDEGIVVPRLSNVLTVESMVVKDATAHCLAILSKRRGDLSAIGESAAGIYSLLGPTTAGRAVDGNAIGGTSMAAPQVSGLAAYLWAIEPSLTPQQLATLIVQTARQNFLAVPGTECDPDVAAPTIDAYAAVLSLDEATPPTPATAPVRASILDVSGDSVFDSTDLEAYHGAYFPNGTPAAPTARDYGRFDLNGDGFTGGDETRAFDLDRVGSTRYGRAQHGTATQLIEGISVPFHETGLTDLEVLCYYAYSGLYAAGGQTIRGNRLAKPCAELTIEPTFPATVVPGVATPLAIRVLRRGLPVSGVELQLGSIGGSVGNGGRTGADGRLQTTATLAVGSQGLTITVTAVNDATELGEAEVTATPVPASCHILAGPVTHRRSEVEFGLVISVDWNVRLRVCPDEPPQSRIVATEAPASGVRHGVNVNGPFTCSISTLVPGVFGSFGGWHLPSAQLSLAYSETCPGSSRTTSGHIPLPGNLVTDATGRALEINVTRTFGDAITTVVNTGRLLPEQ